ncbi:MAG: GNAT family N-acetyltransferase [Kofleriaceae bacterium]|nr:GNAT family N-acetyltransferase [Kofleriaceae bacterium]
MVELLVVAPEHASRRVGRLLFAWALSMARAAGATALYIRANAATRGFYEHLGARVRRERSDGGALLPTGIVGRTRQS